MVKETLEKVVTFENAVVLGAAGAGARFAPEIWNYATQGVSETFWGVNFGAFLLTAFGAKYGARGIDAIRARFLEKEASK